MRIYRYTIPISDYSGEKVFFDQVHLLGHSPPTKKDVIRALTAEHERDKDDPMYFGDSQESLAIVQSCEEFPVITADVASTNVFVNHPKFGLQPLTVTVIEFWDIRQSSFSYQVGVADADPAVFAREAFEAGLRGEAMECPYNVSTMNRHLWDHVNKQGLEKYKQRQSQGS